MIRRSRAGTAAIRIGVAILACGLTLFSGYSARLDEALRDRYLRLLVDPTPEHRLSVVDIDEESLKEIGPWPWPRERIAELIEVLIGEYHAQGVGIDIVFPEPADAVGDQRLIALASHAPLTLAQILDAIPRSHSLALGTPGGGSEALVADAPPAFGHIANHAALATAPCIGNIGYAPDGDGVVRRLPMHARYGGAVYPHFSLALLSCVFPRSGPTPAVLATSTDGKWRVPYRRAPDAYTFISAIDLFNRAVPAELIEGRLILIGSSALSLGDRVSTPLLPLVPGVMVHAAALSGLLDLIDPTASSVAKPSWVLLGGWVIGTILLFAWLVPRLSAFASMLYLVIAAGIWLVVAGWVVRTQTEAPLAAPLFSYLLLLALAVPLEWWRSQRHSQRLVGTLSHYVAQPVLDEILRRGLPHGLEPVLCDVTVLIADMEDYTRNTSSLSLAQAAALTKDFLECLTRPVLEAGGTLDKYTGDGLVAFWGAPLPCDDRSDRAVEAALAVLQAVEKLNARRIGQGLTRVKVRVGIEAGRALVGDLGTPFRSTYTAVGDCINYASRLEAAARDLPVDVVIGGKAAAQLRRHPVVSLGAISVRGTGRQVEVFTVPELMQQESTASGASSGSISLSTGAAVSQESPLPHP